MRTTVDLPPDLMRAAKMRAAERDQSLKDLFARAIAHEIGAPTGEDSGNRLALPLVGADAEPSVEVTNADIEAAFDADDVERYRCDQNARTA